MNNSDINSISPASIRVTHQSTIIMDKKKKHINLITTEKEESLLGSSAASSAAIKPISIASISGGQGQPPLSSQLQSQLQSQSQSQSQSQPPPVPPIPSSVKFSASAAVGPARSAGPADDDGSSPIRTTTTTTTAGGRRTDRISTLSFATISSTQSYSTTNSSSSCSKNSSKATRTTRINNSPILSSPILNMMSNNNSNNNSKYSSIVSNPQGTGTATGSRLSTSSTDVTMMGDAAMARDDLEGTEGGEGAEADSNPNSNSNSYSASASNILNQGWRFLQQQQQKQRPQNNSNSNSNSAAKKQYEETKILLDHRRLNKMDSGFFKENPSHKVPRFNARELSLGGQIGKGEFGAVYEIESLERQPPPSYSDDETIMIEDGILNNSSCTTTTRSNSKSNSITSKNSRESLRESTSAGMPRRNSDNGGPVGASMTLPLNADLFVNNETTLDAYIRRKIDVIKECGEVDFKPPHIQSDTIINLSSDEESSGSSNGDTNNNNAQNQNHQSHRHRRHALKIKDCKGQMIKRAGDVENNDNFDGYAVKLVREDIPSDKKKRVAVVDMASEAKLLSALSHRNIIQIRGILGYVERPDGRYGIIMDKLRLTLQEQIQTWSQLNKEENFTKGVPTPRPLLEHVPKWMLVRQQEKEKLQLYQKQNEFFLDRLDACCDVAQAMQYLHSKRIIYRDLKPENVGLTNENWVVYDFGLSKELKVRDRINNNIYNDTDTDDSDQYRNTTGLTGSRLFMAPEVARCKAYGFSADVYSYSILFWECMSLKEVFPDMTMNKHFQLVIKRGRRPSTMEHIIPNELNTMMIQSWSSNPKHRPSFISICSILDKEIQKRANENNNNSSNNNSSLTFLPWVHNDNDDDQDDDDDDYNEFEDYYSDNNSSYDNDNDNDDDDDDDDDDDHIKSNNARTAAANTGTATRPTIDRGYHSDHDHSSFSQRREQRRNKFLKHFKFDKFTGGSGSIVPEPLKNIPEQIAAKTLEGSSKLSAMMN